MAERRPRLGALPFGRLALIVAALVVATGLAADPRPDRPSGRVAAVIDGDTVVVALADGRTERVRLLGIDAPEMHPSEKLERDVRRSGISRREMRRRGAAARRALAALVHGRLVALERDVAERDRYGRLLAWVWRRDGLLVNEAMLRAGWAVLFTIPPNVRHTDRLRAAQNEARSARRGLWQGGSRESAESPREDPEPDDRPRTSGPDCPVDRPIKGNLRQGSGSTCIYHVPGAPSYAGTKAERCFASEAEAIASGCRPPRR